MVVAQEAAALSAWSGGRFELGMGAGYNRGEYERLGVQFSPRDVRAARLGESLRIIRGLLAGETVTVDGAYYTIWEASLGASPVLVPLIVGGNSRSVHAVAAEHADAVGLAGYSPGASTSDFSRAVVDRQVGRLRELAGTRFAGLELHVLVQWHELTRDREAAWARAARELQVSEEVAADSPYVLVGTAEEMANQIREDRRRFGITRWTVFGDRPDLAPASALAPVLAALQDG